MAASYAQNSKNQPPPPPDYTGAAQATSQGNLALAQQQQQGNMINQFTPYGSVTYTQGDPTTNFNQSAYDAALQQWQQQGQALPGGLAGQAAQQAWRAAMPTQAQFTTTTPGQWSQNVQMSPEQQALFNQNQAINQQLGGVAQQGLGYVQNALNAPLQSPGQAQGSAATTNFAGPVAQGKMQTNAGRSGNIQTALANNAGQIRTNAGNPQLLQQNVTNAVYNQQASLIEPQLVRQQQQLESQLANQGITRGSQAWNDAMQQQNMQRQQAYQSAMNNAIQQGVGASQGMFGQQLAGMQAGNQALGQQFGQGVTAQQAANMAQQQQFAQNMANAQLRNQAALSTFGMGLQNATLQNQAAQQQFAQNLANAQLGNQALQQNFQNAQTLQQNPLNILNAVRSGQQMQVGMMPQVGVSSPAMQGQVAGPDLLGALQGQYGAQMAGYNAQQAQQQQQMNGLLTLAMMSDPRAKQNIHKVGVMANGLGVYAFEYKPAFREEFGDGVKIGVMADEVEKFVPEAIVMRPDGYRAVNYAML